MKYMLLYESAEGVRKKAPPHVSAHGARIREFHARGTLLMIGVFENPEEGRRASSPPARPPRSSRGATPSS